MFKAFSFQILLNVSAKNPDKNEISVTYNYFRKKASL